MTAYCLLAIKLEAFKVVLDLGLWVRSNGQARGIIFRLLHPHLVVNGGLSQLIGQSLELFLVLGLQDHLVHVVKVGQVCLGVGLCVEEVDGGGGGVAGLSYEGPQVPRLLLQQIAPDHDILN